MYQAQEVCFISYTSLFRPAVLLRFPHITAIVRRAKDTEILLFQKAAKWQSLKSWLQSKASLIQNYETFPGAMWMFQEVIQRSSFCEGRRFTGGSFPLKQVLSTSEKGPVCYKSCLLTIFVLFYKMCAPRILGKEFAGAHTWSHPAGKPCSLPCWQMAQGGNTEIMTMKETGEGAGADKHAETLDTTILSPTEEKF